MKQFTVRLVLSYFLLVSSLANAATSPEPEPTPSPPSSRISCTAAFVAATLLLVPVYTAFLFRDQWLPKPNPPAAAQPENALAELLRFETRMNNGADITPDLQMLFEAEMLRAAKSVRESRQTAQEPGRAFYGLLVRFSLNSSAMERNRAFHFDERAQLLALETAGLDREQINLVLAAIKRAQILRLGQVPPAGRSRIGIMADRTYQAQSAVVDMNYGPDAERLAEATLTLFDYNSRSVSWFANGGDNQSRDGVRLGEGVFDSYAGWRRFLANRNPQADALEHRYLCGVAEISRLKAKQESLRE